MPSKIVVAHQKVSGEIDAAFTTHGPAIADAVHAVMIAAEPPSKVNVKPLLDYALNTSKAALATLVLRDNEYQTELGDDAAPREERDAAAAALNAEIVRLKQATNNLFGPSWVSKLTFPKAVPSDPAHIKRTAEQVLSALATHTLPHAQIPGVGKVDASEWKATLEKPLRALNSALEDVKREEKEAIAARDKRDSALEALIEANVGAAQLAQALARIGKVSRLVEGLRGTLDSTVSRASENGDAPVTPPVTPPNTETAPVIPPAPGPRPVG